MLWLCQDSRILLETTICCRKKPVLLRTVEALFQIVTWITKPRFSYMLQQYPWFKGLPLVFFHSSIPQQNTLPPQKRRQETFLWVTKTAPARRVLSFPHRQMQDLGKATCELCFEQRITHTSRADCGSFSLPVPLGCPALILSAWDAVLSMGSDMNPDRRSPSTAAPCKQD